MQGKSLLLLEEFCTGCGGDWVAVLAKDADEDGGVRLGWGLGQDGGVSSGRRVLLSIPALQAVTQDLFPTFVNQ